MPVNADPERARKIRRLFRLGMTPQAAAAAVDADRVTLGLLDHLIGGAREFTRAEAAARAGVGEELAATIERIAGLHDGVRYSEAEIHHLSLIGRLQSLMPDERVVDHIRGDMPMLRTMALRTLDTAEQVLLRTAREELDDPIDLALRINEAAKPLLDVSTELVGQSFRRIVLHLLTTDLIAQAMRTEDETVEVAVGFVDVVGYTSLSGRIDPTGLADVLTAFEHSCLELVEANQAVQLVKFMGDAGMFVSLDPLALATALFELVQPIEDADQPLGYAPIRAGVSAGQTLFRSGDYFGPAVNEAARLTDLARRNTVLAADHLRDALAEDFKLRHIRPVMLHGIGMRRPYALRHRLVAG